MSGREFLTFGCRLNAFETQVMADHAERAGLGGGSRGDGFTRLNVDLIRGDAYRDESVVDGVRYAYMVGAVDESGTETLAGPVEILADLGVKGLALSPPSPNPRRETDVSPPDRRMPHLRRTAPSRAAPNPSSPSAGC